MTKTAIRLGGFFPNQQNYLLSYLQILNILAFLYHYLSQQSMSIYKNVKITISVYWDGGQQITIKISLAGGATKHQ